MNVMFYFRHHYEFSLFTHHSSLFFWWNLAFHWNSIMTLTIYLFTMPRTVRTPDSFHWKLGLWLLQFNSPASFFVIFVHSKFVPFLTHSSSLKWKFIFRILDGSNSEFQIKISKFWITLTGDNLMQRRNLVMLFKPLPLSQVRSPPWSVTWLNHH